MRDIDSILRFRSDLSPFLVHLTKDESGGRSAKENLTKILTEKQLLCSDQLISDARFGMLTSSLTEAEKQDLFSAICFTETPLNEVHSLLEISYRGVDLKPYGLAFLKERLADRGVSPVLYINNIRGNSDALFQAMCTLCETRRNEAKRLLPLMAVFGKKIQPPAASNPQSGDVNFIWEREWRQPKSEGQLGFEANDVFIGFCPHEEIDHFDDMNLGF
ncbi:MAG: hypothetical protein ABIK83_01085 [Candidatus Zixiibacteriota bacterium]